MQHKQIRAIPITVNLYSCKLSNWPQNGLMNIMLVENPGYIKFVSLSLWLRPLNPAQVPLPKLGKRFFYLY